MYFRHIINLDVKPVRVNEMFIAEKCTICCFDLGALSWKPKSFLCNKNLLVI